MKQIMLLLAALVLCLHLSAQEKKKFRSFSGIYPHLAYYNTDGECGGGAVVPWAGKLWGISYSPHRFNGSDDKLFEINPDLTLTNRPESVGGTPANRLIHKESNQLFIGPYAIDAKGNVRVISPSVMPGRLTGSARHLFDPANKIYTATMEEGFYEIDVHTLAVKVLSEDENVNSKKPPLLNGWHGKGLYSGQNHLYYSNNGEYGNEAKVNPRAISGVLAEWDGKGEWKQIEREQYTEITGPGGIYGSTSPDKDPIWALGWDDRSVILKLRQNNNWLSFRLPKASHSYDGAHGWNTEWPRIRNIGSDDKPDYLMTMHGMFWKFPGTFSPKNTAGIRPYSSYLKIIGDFCNWNGLLVCACDDGAQKEFLNFRKFKSGHTNPVNSQSNLWFLDPSDLDHLGVTSANGAVWNADSVKANQLSLPFLFKGWSRRSVQIGNRGRQSLKLVFEVDKLGNNKWTPMKTIVVEPNTMSWNSFSEKEVGEWVRVKALQPCSNLTVMFNYVGDDAREINKASEIFNGIATLDDKGFSAGLIRSLDLKSKSLEVLTYKESNGNFNLTGYSLLDSALNFSKSSDVAAAINSYNNLKNTTNGITVDQASVIVVDENNNRWRLPKGDSRYDSYVKKGSFRFAREVVTERDVFNCHGTFYELPADNAGGIENIRPISSHNFQIMDFASYRGMMVMTGISKTTNNNHIISSEDATSSVWLGTVDDLWKMGKPCGKGGPWYNSKVIRNQFSDPYLMTGYDKKTLTLKSDKDVKITIEVNFNHRDFYTYKEVSLKANETYKYDFPNGYVAHWIRFKADSDCNATAILEYY